MDIREIFRETIETISPIDRLINQTLSFRVIDKDARMLCMYSMLNNRYQFNENPIVGRENWMKENNAVSASMESGKMEVVIRGKHDNPGLKQYYSVACPIFVNGVCEYYFAALIKNVIDEKLEVFRTYAKLFEEKLARKLEKEKREKHIYLLQAILKAIPEACLVISPEGNILYCNAQAVTYASEPIEKMIGCKMPEDKLQSIIKVEQGRYVRNEEVTFENIQKEKKTAIRSVIPVYDDQKNVIAILDLLKDIKSIKETVNIFSGNIAKYTFSDIIHKSAVMERVIQQAEYIAGNDHPVLIESESGTGKELLAHAIHNASLRKRGPFVVLDCSSISKDLAESELFGYEPGAFTGAAKGGKMGKIELASGGTLFLDEIGELSLNLQVKLLRLLQEKTFTRIGSTKRKQADIRIIAATNRDLLLEVEKKNFRLDLYYRLNVFTERIPPLRERPEDIPVLAEYFIRRYQTEFSKYDIRLSDEAYQLIISYQWPGNVRELENAIIRAVALCDGIILPEHFIFSNQKNVEANHTEEPDEADHVREHMENKSKTSETITQERVERALKDTDGNISKSAELLNISRNTLYKKIREYGLMKEKKKGKARLSAELIQQVLQNTSGNRTEAARQLGISRKTLYLKMNEFHIS